MRITSLEILTSQVPSLLWEEKYNEFLGRPSKEIFGINHADWKNPRRGFYLEGHVYYIDIQNKTLRKKQSENILIREFDKISFSNRYILEESPKDVLNSFLKEGYVIL